MAIDDAKKIYTPHRGFQEKFVNSNVDFVIGGGAMGGGKEQPLDSKILTPTGWRLMGDIRVGDEVLTPFDGVTMVVGVFPQGVKDVYRLTTDDGRSCECGLEHLWSVRTRKQIHKHRENGKDKTKWLTTLTTKELIEDYISKGKAVYLPVNDALDFPDTNLPIDKSGTIPENCLFLPKDRREELLSRLLSADISANDSDGARFIALCRSLGYVATEKRDCADNKHRLVVAKKDYIRIVSIEKVRRAECQCILVDNDKHLYITDDYIVTHNSFAALLMAADQVHDPNFRMVFIRRNIGDLKVGGGGADEASKLYGNIGVMKMSENPRLTFPSGAFIDFTHMSDQTPDKVLERIKGWQYSCIYVDEATGFEWSTIRMLLSRMRSQAKWSGKFRCTCNPKRRHWLRYWVDWYVDDYGDPIPERDGVVRYYFVTGDDITDVVFGSSKKDVYNKCRGRIDKILAKMNASGEVIHTYEDLIKSYTFYGGNVSENISMLKNNPGYIGSVAAMGERQANANLLGNWNQDDDDDDMPIKKSEAANIDENEPQRNGELWLTCDLADTGTDNCVILVWDGLHITDYMLIEKSTPAKNCNMIEFMAAKHNIGDGHIIYDAMRAAYMIDRFPNAIGYISYRPATGVYKRLGDRLKDVNFLRLVELVNNNRISMSPAVAKAPYTHQGRAAITFKEEFVKECGVVFFDTTSQGKYRLPNKKKMNSMLGGKLSMDLLDAITMRFLPLTGCEYGEELGGSGSRMPYADADCPNSIYDDSNWF